MKEGMRIMAKKVNVTPRDCKKPKNGECGRYAYCIGCPKNNLKKRK